MKIHIRFGVFVLRLPGVFVSIDVSLRPRAFVRLGKHVWSSSMGYRRIAQD